MSADEWATEKVSITPREQARLEIARQTAEFEAKNGPVKTMPIQQRQFTASGIPKIGADEGVKLESTERRAMSAIRGGCRTPAEIREKLSGVKPGTLDHALKKLVARGYVRRVSRGNYEPAIKPQYSSLANKK